MILLADKDCCNLVTAKVYDWYNYFVESKAIARPDPTFLHGSAPVRSSGFDSGSHINCDPPVKKFFWPSLGNQIRLSISAYQIMVTTLNCSEICSSCICI